MSTQNGRQTIQLIFAELANGNSRPFVEAMHEDLAWTISGQGPWARTWYGKDVVRTELFRPLFAQFASPYRNRAKSFVAEGNTVVVECKGDVVTKQGNRYDNDYCYICRLGDDGRLIAVTEYMDTALAERVLAPPR